MVGVSLKHLEDDGVDHRHALKLWSSQFSLRHSVSLGIKLLNNKVIRHKKVLLEKSNLFSQDNLIVFWKGFKIGPGSVCLPSDGYFGIDIDQT